MITVCHVKLHETQAMRDRVNQGFKGNEKSNTKFTFYSSVDYPFITFSNIFAFWLEYWKNRFCFSNSQNLVQNALKWTRVGRDLRVKIGFP